jgi:hypothetical protein
MSSKCLANIHGIDYVGTARNRLSHGAPLSAESDIRVVSDEITIVPIFTLWDGQECYQCYAISMRPTDIVVDEPI